MAWIDEAVADEGVPLGLGQSIGESPCTSFINRRLFDQLEYSFVLESPTAISRISRFTGMLKLRVPQRSATVLVEDVYSRVGQEIDHPELQRARMKFKVSRDRDSKFLKIGLVAGDPAGIGRFETVEKFAGGSSISIHPDGVSLWFSELPRSPVTLRMTVYSDLTEVEVPLDFVNIPVPPVPQANSERTRIPAGIPMPAPAPVRAVTEPAR